VGILRKGRVPHDEGDVDDEADCHEESGEGLQFVVGGQQVLDHFEEGFGLPLFFPDEFMGRGGEYCQCVYIHLKQYSQATK
jgi:hypothetical protein